MSFIFAISFLMMFLLSPKNVNAVFYERSENKLLTFSTKRQGSDSGVDVSIQYQNAIQGVEVYICTKDQNTASSCATSTALSHYVSPNFDTWIINKNGDRAIYNMHFDNVTDGGGIHITQYNDTDDNQYRVLVKAVFCVALNDTGNDCADNMVDEEYQDIYFEIFTLDKSFTGSGTVNSTIARVLEIVNNIVIPVLWVLMGVLLLVRGIMLGIDIVKNSDDPEIRKKKITGLVWLFIGVGIGYIITIAASAIMTTFGYGGLFS